MDTDDIVTRLREEAITIVENNGFWLDVPNAFNNCADEIERLRGEIERLGADRDRWQQAAESLITQCGCDSHCPRFLEYPNGECECGFNEPFQLYQKAVRGD